MIPTDLQDHLIERFRREMVGLQLNSTQDNERTAEIKVFPQHLPRPEKQKRSSELSPEQFEANQQFPSITVRLHYGGGRDPHDFKTARVNFIVGVYDAEDNHQGYRDAMTIAKRIEESLVKSPIVDDLYTCSPEIEWAYYDEEVQPFFFLGLETDWQIPEYIRDDEVEAMI
ncbi:hypothetical protein JCM19037_4590 [Geomicrobium sp. JCM 19037]|uniref:hypothetical protein n=1 Tax=Geomicrobium sp. JCM 19037 TaxID=1460634 RepID=UPI00045F27C5|nr:hypothetical protein [Geomicrobium sp. JCM 19037]GAK06037.1 hypothetical protein JCM19037_4590 [Geomicrobium sp. JCM 19037]